MTPPDETQQTVAAVRAARAAGLSTPQTAILLSVAASHALDNRPLNQEELAAGALLLAGRIDFDTYRRWLHV